MIIIRVAVCDDEVHFRDRILKYTDGFLREYGYKIQIDEYETGTELLAAIKNGMRYQIIFLDIAVGAENGVEIARKIQDYTDEYFLVFVTAYGEYASEGYKIDAFRYIEKRKNIEDELEECLEAVMKKLDTVVPVRTFEFREGMIKVPLDKIWYIESDLHFLTYHIMEDTLKKYTRRGKLSDIEKELSDKFFIRIHQSYLVNARYIYRIKERKVILKNGMELDIARPRYKQVREQFVKYSGRW